MGGAVPAPSSFTFHPASDALLGVLPFHLGVREKDLLVLNDRLESSATPLVKPPDVDTEVALGWWTLHETFDTSIQSLCCASVDSPLIPSI
jgi:hypothetical protein